MGMLDAYADDTAATLQAMQERPVMPEPPKPKHSAWTAIPRALAAAGAEVVGNVSDVLDAFGQTAAATGGMGAGIRTPDEKRDQQADEAFRKLTTEGIDWRSEDSRAAYAFGRDLRPDPLTAGTAEQAIFGITKSVSKAVGSALTLGPVGGALGFGVSEGMTAAEDLADLGVDAETRFKVGGITAGMGTVGALLPVAGSTTAKTVALVLGGGPASFMAQQAAISSVLENADYGELAAQYDPLDPLGLTIATLVPAAFGTAARLGARRAGSPQADVDAAMTHNLTAMQDLRAAVDDVTGQPSPDVQGAMGGGARAAADTETQVRVTEPDQGVVPAQPELNAGVRPDAANDAPDAVAARVKQVLDEQPDLVARVDDDGKPVKWADELEAVRREAQEGTDDALGAMDAPLLQVAAECALATGTAGL